MQSLICCPTKVDYILMVHNKRGTYFFWDKFSDVTRGIYIADAAEITIYARKCAKGKRRRKTRQMG